MQPSKSKLLFLAVGASITLFLIVFSLVTLLKSKISFPIPIKPFFLPQADLKKFSSEEEFKAYIQKGQQASGAFYGFGGGLGLERAPSVDIGLPSLGALPPERISETNVQVKGIDEPDIVKTDGAKIYVSSELGKIYPARGIPIIEDRILPPPEFNNDTKIVNAFPPSGLVKESIIDKSGNLLLHGNILIVFSADSIYGFDVSNPKSPTEKWKIKLEENTQLSQARLFDGKLYIVTKLQINPSRPCPIIPMSFGISRLSIPCIEIYYPVTPTNVDVTYTGVSIDPKTGQALNKVSFVGSSGQSVTYMSKNAIYITYPILPDTVQIMYGFLKENAKDLIDEATLKSLEKLISYDISNQSKMTELQVILERFYNSLSADQRLKIQNEIQNRLSLYSKSHKREFEKTGIVKTALTNFDVSATGTVAGSPLNQFALDEYQNNLRVAVTVGGNWFLGFGQSESANDVYILDKNLKEIGSVSDLGLTERIYSVRFIEDKAFVVTFRQIDPFYVLDLSNPASPRRTGELKIPGFSSYLHPINKDKIIGVGQENQNVKISLFDVSDPVSPTEVSKYNLDEFWTEVSQTHHAFLLDDKHGVFFLPGGKGGYIFSYKNDVLQLSKAISETQVRRAIFINDYMYIIGENKIVVLSEADWEIVNQLEI
ncbi:beta-propeller domain-containing protein [Candidatus Woesebacteria bacterium]|nr:beta-propeller domain-containing protein [Candidatus Woesebacteria bacterium]